MNEEAKNEVESINSKKSDAVKAYFTKEVRSQINEMTQDEMKALLKGLIATREWIAIVKYIEMREVVSENSLKVINPVTDPYTIAFSQGTLAGINDLEIAVIALNAEEVAEPQAPAGANNN